MDKILSGGQTICLFCGKEKKVDFEEYERFYYCDCPDAVETEKINKQIEDLRRKLPRPKFEIRTRSVLSKVKEF
jgi:hypothetical protein